MRRRDFITGLGGAAFWPLSAHAQQSRSMRKIGLLVNYLQEDLEGQARIEAFVEALRKLGWIEGENLHTEIRYGGDEAERYQRFAKELVETAPDVIVSGASPSVAALQGITHNVPVVFAGVIDPVGAGFVKSLARPGGNVTGFRRAQRRRDRDGKRVIKQAPRADARAGTSISPANGLSAAILRRGWRPCLLRTRCCRHLSACSRIRRPHTQGRETGGSPGPGSHTVQARRKSQDRAGFGSFSRQSLIVRADEVIE